MEDGGERKRHGGRDGSDSDMRGVDAGQYRIICQL